jgi:hypothetical protein
MGTQIDGLQCRLHGSACGLLDNDVIIIITTHAVVAHDVIVGSGG